MDAAVYVVRHDYTKMRQILEGIQTLSMSGIQMLGYVYNDDFSGKGGYGYGYNDGYGRYNRGGHYYGRYRTEKVDSRDEFGRVYKE